MLLPSASGGPFLKVPSGPDSKEPACNEEYLGSIPELGRWQPTPVSLPGKSHGQRTLAGFRPCSHKELDTTEGLPL